jgi:hypothetical protein
MNYNAFVDRKTRQVNRAAIASGTGTIVSGAHWFWWIAVLSLLHLVLKCYDIEHGAPLSLSLTMNAIGTFGSAQLPAYVFLAGVLLFFLLVGWSASRGSIMAFIIGAAIYSIDALLSLQAPTKLAFGFHLLALYFILRGMFALHNALATAEIAAQEQEREYHPAPPPDNATSDR